MTMKIWTRFYEPLVMGGPVWQARYIEVDEGPEYDVGHGIKAHKITSPDGYDVIVEQKSGGIVSDSIEDLIRDLKTIDKNTAELTVESAIRYRDSHNFNEISVDEFWKRHKATRNVK